MNKTAQKNKVDAAILGFTYAPEVQAEKSISQILGTNFKERVLNKAAGRELDGTIPEDIFIEEMITLWSGYGNKYNSKFIECWKGILFCFNRSLSEAGLNVSSATMGAGKTTTALLCLAIYAVLYPTKGAMMVSRRIAECDEIEEGLNELLGSNIALAIHSKSQQEDKWKENVESFKIILTTHIGFLSSKSIYKKDVLSMYNGAPRELTIIDESIAFISRYRISKKFIAEIKHKLALFNDPFVWDDDYHDELRKIASIYREIDRVEASQDGYLLREVFSEIEQKNNKKLNRLAQRIASTTADEWDERRLKKLVHETDDYTFLDFKQTLINDILSVQSILSLSLWATQEVNTQVTLSSGEIMNRISGILLQDENIKSCVILDATSHIDNTYTLLQEKFGDIVHIQPPVDGVRDYHNVTFKFRPESSGVGKNTSVTRASSRAIKILDWAEEEFVPTDRVIFCGTKKLMNTLEKEIGSRKTVYEYAFLHFGCIDGRNDMTKFNKMVFLSTPFPATNYHEQSIIAFGLEDKYLDKDNLSKFRADSDASYVATKLGQAIGRDAKRKVTSNRGDCSPCTVYLILRGGMVATNTTYKDAYERLEPVSKDVLGLIQGTFPNAVWESWNGFGGWADSKKGRRQSNVVTKVVNHISKNLQVGETVDLNEVIFDLGITGKEVPTVKNAFKKTFLEQKSLGQTLKDLGISVASKRGKGGGTKITKSK